MILDKTQYQIENDYYFIDLPALLRIKNEKKAMQLLEQLQVTSYPHITDQKARNNIMKAITSQLPAKPKGPVKSAEEQYQARMARMKVG